MLHVGGRGGIQAISYTYDKVNKFWQGEAEPAAQNAQQIGSSNDVGELRSTKRTLGFSDIELTLENMPQQQQQQVVPQQSQPRPLVTRQRTQIEVGQEVLPGNDRDDHNNHDDHDTTNDDGVLEQIDHQAYIERMAKGKHTDCPMWRNDPWPGERQQWMEAFEISNRMIARLEEQLNKQEAATTTIATNINSAIINNANVGQTPMMKNIATPPSPPNAIYKQCDCNAIQNPEEGDDVQKPTRTIQVGNIVYNGGATPGSGGTLHGAREIGIVCQLGGSGYPGGDPGDRSDGEDDINNHGERQRGDNQYREFTLVSPNKIIVPTFSGIHLNRKPYMQFNKAIKKLIKAQGANGMNLITILEDVTTYGDKPYGNNKLVALAEQEPRAYEYSIAIQNVLDTYTTDLAESMGRYGVHNGLDAWRKLYHHHAPLAKDLQQISLQELFDIKPVSEADVDNLFGEIQRISEWYIKAGDDVIAEQWLVAAVKRNLPLNISTDLSMELRKLITADQIRNVINIYRHDHRTGLPMGKPWDNVGYD